MKNGTHPSKQIVEIKETHHWHFNDMIMFSPITIFLADMSCPQINLGPLYKMSTLLPLKFLKKQGIGYFDIKDIDD